MYARNQLWFYVTNVYIVILNMIEGRHFLGIIDPVVSPFLLVGVLNCKYLRMGRPVALVVNSVFLCSTALRDSQSALCSAVSLSLSWLPGLSCLPSVGSSEDSLWSPLVLSRTGSLGDHSSQVLSLVHI